MRVFILLLSMLCVARAMRNQAYAVHGRLICGPKPASNVRVKLWEEDTGPDPDDLLEAGYTDSNGEFRLSGHTMELTPIDPILKVYHDCDDGIKPGKRKIRFKLPKSYITDGKVAKKDFDIGILNLETIFPKEERELIVTRKRRCATWLKRRVNSEENLRYKRHVDAEESREMDVIPDEDDGNDFIRPMDERRNPCWDYFL